MTRIIIVVFGLLTGGATHMGIYGIGGEDETIAQSIRSGSAGRAGYVGGVK